MEVTHTDDVTDREGCGGQLQTKRRISQGRECCAPGCSNMQLDKDGNTTGTHFFRFPQDESRRALWCQKIKLSDKVDEITANSVLCERHFKKEDIRRTPYGANRCILKKDAAPQISCDGVITTRRGRKLSKPQRYQEYEELEESTDESPPKKTKSVEREKNSALCVEPPQPNPSTTEQEQREQTPPLAPDVQEVASDLNMNKLQLQSEWLEKMNQLRKQGLFCDVHLELNGRAIRAHRVVLSACSAQFHQKLATGGAILPPEDFYSLDFIRAFEMVIEFAYTAQIQLTVNNVHSVMQIAFHYQILPLVDECYTYLKWLKERKLNQRPLAASNGFNLEEAAEEWLRKRIIYQSADTPVFDDDDSNEGPSSQSSLSSSSNGVEAGRNATLCEGDEQQAGERTKSAADTPKNHCRESAGSAAGDNTQLRRLLISKTLALENRFEDVFGSREKNAGDDASWTFDCARALPAEDGLERHTLFLCVECGKSFNSKVKLVNHQKLHFKEPVKCKYCAETFTWKQSLDHHVVTQHYDVLDPQEIATFSSVSPSTTEEGSPGVVETEGREKERVHFCGVCGRGFSERYRLMRHEKIHTGEKPFKCDQCEKMFSRKDNLDRHFFVQHLIRDREIKANEVDGAGRDKEGDPSKDVNNEDGEVAEENGKILLSNGIKQESDLSLEMKDSYVSTLMGQLVPRTTKPHACLVCGKSFTNKYRLVRHEVIHTGERPYKCEICSRKFTRKDHMERHKSRQHPNGEMGTPSRKGRKPKVAVAPDDECETATGLPDFQCHLCGMVFQDKVGLALHKKCHEFVDCKDCKTIFLNEEDYRLHDCAGNLILEQKEDLDLF